MTKRASCPAGELARSPCYVGQRSTTTHKLGTSPRTTRGRVTGKDTTGLHGHRVRSGLRDVLRNKTMAPISRPGHHGQAAYQGRSATSGGRRRGCSRLPAARSPKRSAPWLALGPSATTVRCSRVRTCTCLWWRLPTLHTGRRESTPLSQAFPTSSSRRSSPRQGPTLTPCTRRSRVGAQGSLSTRCSVHTLWRPPPVTPVSRCSLGRWSTLRYGWTTTSACPPTCGETAVVTGARAPRPPSFSSATRSTLAASISARTTSKRSTHACPAARGHWYTAAPPASRCRPGGGPTSANEWTRYRWRNTTGDYPGSGWRPYP